MGYGDFRRAQIRTQARAKPRKRPGLLQQLVRLPAEAGKGIAQLGWKTATTPISAARWAAKNVHDPVKFGRGLGDIATAGIFTKGSGAFEAVQGGQGALLPGVLGGGTALAQHVRHPTQYYRSATGKEGSPDFLNMLLGDIGTAAIVAGGAGAALGKAAKVASAGGNVARAGRLAGVAETVGRVGALGGEVADLGIPRAVRGVAGKILPEASPAAIAEAAARGRKPSVWSPVVEAVANKGRGWFEAGPTGSGRARLRAQYPKILTTEGRRISQATQAGVEAGGRTAREITNPIYRAVETPEIGREGPLLGPAVPPQAVEPHVPPPFIGPLPPIYGPPAPVGRRPSSNRTQVPQWEPYVPEPLQPRPLQPIGRTLATGPPGPSRLGPTPPSGPERVVLPDGSIGLPSQAEGLIPSPRDLDPVAALEDMTNALDQELGMGWEDDGDAILLNYAATHPHVAEMLRLYDLRPDPNNPHAIVDWLMDTNDADRAIRLGMEPPSDMQPLRPEQRAAAGQRTHGELDPAFQELNNAAEEMILQFDRDIPDWFESTDERLRAYIDTHPEYAAILEQLGLQFDPNNPFAVVEGLDAMDQLFGAGEGPLPPGYDPVARLRELQEQEFDEGDIEGDLEHTELDQTPEYQFDRNRSFLTPNDAIKVLEPDEFQAAETSLIDYYRNVITQLLEAVDNVDFERLMAILEDNPVPTDINLAVQRTLGLENLPAMDDRADGWRASAEDLSIMPWLGPDAAGPILRELMARIDSLDANRAFLEINPNIRATPGMAESSGPNAIPPVIYQDVGRRRRRPNRGPGRDRPLLPPQPMERGAIGEPGAPGPSRLGTWQRPANPAIEQLIDESRGRAPQLPETPMMPTLDAAALPGVDLSVLTTIVQRVQRALDALQDPRADQAAVAALNQPIPRMDDVIQSWQAFGDPQRAAQLQQLMDLVNFGLPENLGPRGQGLVVQRLEQALQQAQGMYGLRPTPRNIPTPGGGPTLRAQGTGGFQQQTPFAQVVSSLPPGGRGRTTLPRPPGAAGPPTPPVLPPVQGPALPPQPSTPALGPRNYDPQGRLSEVETAAGASEYTGSRANLESIVDRLESMGVTLEEVADMAVPDDVRSWIIDELGRRHPEFFTAEATRLASEAAGNRLPTEQTSRLGRYQEVIGETAAEMTARRQAGRGQDPLDEAMLDENLRGLPMPDAETVDLLATHGLISFDDAQRLRGLQLDPTTGEWVPSGVSEDVLRRQREAFYMSEPWDPADPRLRDPMLYAATWRPRMAETGNVGRAMDERVAAMNRQRQSLLPNAAVFGAPLETPRLAYTPMEMAAEGQTPRYLPGGAEPSPTVGLDRRLETLDQLQGNVPPRASHVRSAEQPVGPVTGAGLARRWGTEARRSEMNYVFDEIIARGGKFSNAYMWDGTGQPPDNPFLAPETLQGIYDRATANHQQMGGKFQLHYNMELVRVMEANGWEPWPKKGAIGKELTMKDRQIMSNADAREATFRRTQAADIDAETPWLRAGLREDLAPYMTPRVPGTVIRGLAKSNQVFKGLTLAPNVRWQIGDAVFQYLMASMEGIPPWEFRRYINKVRETSGRPGDVPRPRLRGRKAQSSMRYGGSESGRRLYDSMEQQNLRIGDDPLLDVRPNQKVRPGREAREDLGQKVTRRQQILDPTTGRFKDASFGYNQVTNATRREAMALLQLDKRLKRKGFDIDDEGSMDRLAASSSVTDKELYDDIIGAIERTNKIFGNTDKLAPFERDYLVHMFPFWTWTSTVARLTGMLAVNHPARLAFTMWLGTQVANDPSPELPGYQGTIKGPGGYWPTAFMNPFADIGGLPGLDEGSVGPGSILRSSTPALKLAGAAAGFDVGQGQYLSRPPGTNRRDPYGRESYTPIWKDPGAMLYQTLSQVPLGKRVINALPRMTIPLPGTDITTGNVVRYDTGESMGFGAGTPLPTRLGSLLGLPLPMGQSRTEETLRLTRERDRTYKRGARDRRRAAARRRSQTSRLGRVF